jgi:CRISPR/Cas system-associated exonuclease Cas4 (RecB family)
MESNDKPHLSVTQLNLYLTCGEAYRRRYVEGDKEPPGAARLTGQSFHAGVELNMRQKIVSHVDLKPDEAIDYAVDHLETEADKVGLQSIEVGKVSQTVSRALSTHIVDQAWAWQPELVEQRIDLQLPSATHDFVGYLDFVGELSEAWIYSNPDEPTQGEHWVIDWKTSGRKPSAGVEHSDLQLSAYAALATEQYGWTGTINVGQVYTIRGKETEVRLSERDSRDTVRFARMVNHVLAGIAAGIFPPAHPGHWKCSPRWCGYYRTCPYVSQRDATNREKLIKAFNATKVENDE